MKVRAACLALILSIACASTTPEGSAVRVTSDNLAIQGCAYLGEVKAGDHMWGGAAGQGIAEENAHRRLKNKAAEMGADTVLLSMASTNWGGSSMRGEAYDCRRSSTP